MRTRSLIALVSLFIFCLYIVPGAVAAIYRVPSDVPTLPQAIELAQRGDIIELAVGKHKLAGREIMLKPGLTIRTDTGMPGGVVLEECACYCGDYRNRPVFILDADNDPCRFEGITFSNFTLSCSPDEYANNPVFHVVEGTLKFTDCKFYNFYKTMSWFDGGVGRFLRCEFDGGVGCPTLVHFGGERLVMEDCTVTDQRGFNNCGEFRGTLLQLLAGETFLLNTMLHDNGPLVTMIEVGPLASLEARDSCFIDNITQWEGRVLGTALLDCCTIDPVLWYVAPEGELTIIEDRDKAATVESTTWTDVRNLFQ
jgi:hypothetical protein